MAIDTIIAHYGLLAIFAGAGIEGEAVVITGGVLAHQGLLSLPGVALAAAAGSCCVDQIWFFLGRRFRDHPWIQAMTKRPAFARALRELERRPTGFIFAFRFIYGLRTVSPIAIGVSTVPARRFIPLNILAAALWAPLIAGLGFVFGKMLDPWLHDLRGVVLGVMAAVIVVSAGVAAWRWRRGAA
ncbi:DedA family protein [Sphingomonas nostoxanthinifaciens]|uniref:DedA family protein n=1 Tax=Sphingomonas nostoxanthinifaciens TaxID=2872652 RepID=UPI001CC1EF71|nr:DedA family protein [Sphingomonas nostoxanthinifaciens]UAK23248.1 DedA family protein [Sphingomonas nostoxanthinifaciens]